MSLLDPSVWAGALTSALAMMAPAPAPLAVSGTPMSQLSDHIERLAPATTDRARIERLVNAYWRKAKPDCDDPEVQRFDWTHEKRQGNYWVGAAKLRGRFDNRLVPVGTTTVLAEITPQGIRLLDVLDQRDYDNTPEQRAFFERADRVMRGEAVASLGAVARP